MPVAEGLGGGTAPMPAKDITDFQSRCLERLESFLDARGYPADFQLVYGREENYLRAESDSPQGKVTIYLYEDEAGFYWNRRWVMKEWGDFPRDEEGLIEALVADLQTFCFSEDE